MDATRQDTEPKQALDEWREKMKRIYAETMQDRAVQRRESSRDFTRLPGYLRRRNNLRRGTNR